MSANLSPRMSADEFLEWCLLQDERYELVDGEPRLMTGARVGHDRVVGNVMVALRNRLDADGSPCEVFTDDIALPVPVGNIRRPDLAMYCPPYDDRALALERPRLIVEVLSESTQFFDQLHKLEEYQAIPGLDYILYIVPDFRAVGLWTRDAHGTWQKVEFHDADDSVELPRLGIALPLSEIYRRVTFQERRRLRLVGPDEA